MVDGDDVRQARDQAEETGKSAGRAVEQSKAYRWLVTVGLICYGIVHLLIAWVAGQLALGGSSGGEEASSSGALRSLAQQPWGEVLMVVIAIGFGTLVIWQLLQALFGHHEFEDKKRIRKRLASAGKVILYGALGFSAVRLATTGDDGGGGTEESLTGKLMGMPLGRILVIVVGVVVIAVGISMIVKAVRQKFTEELNTRPGTGARVLGTLGYIAKGIAIGVVGALFGWAAITFDPDKAGGTDEALRTILEQPFGTFLLLAVALGFAAYGLYCFYWSRYPKTTAA
ncbi:DUF1206 domain-containing protein [Enemella sp. A6]|uniref:DUF1206 domain-containing protein n=1 Tax=Enemella sp. A6 TaxID=3440152 RepID=UPI003EBDCA50